MFTSEPSLAQRIERMIGDVPIVDTRSYLVADQLQAPDLAALINEPPTRLALDGVGMPPDVFHPDRAGEEQVILALPYLRQVRNTSAAWCLFRIFRDLYGFDEPHLSLDNYQGLMDSVAQAAAEPDRAREVIVNRGKIRRVVAPSPRNQPDSAASEASAFPGFLVHRLDIVATDAADAPPDQVRSRVFDQLDAEIEGTVRFAAFDAIPDPNNLVHRAVLAWHDLHGSPVQVVLDPFNSLVNPVDRIASLVAHHPAAKFGLMTGSTRFGPEIAALAGRSPNAFVEGDAGWGAWPAMIEGNLLARIQQVAMTRISAFSSGARSAEWVYGSLQATRKATASALAQAVASGFFEEDELPPILRAIFADSPTAWYRLDD